MGYGVAKVGDRVVQVTRGPRGVIVGRSRRGRIIEVKDKTHFSWMRRPRVGFVVQWDSGSISHLERRDFSVEEPEDSV